MPSGDSPGGRAVRLANADSKATSDKKRPVSFGNTGSPQGVPTVNSAACCLTTIRGPLTVKKSWQFRSRVE